MVLNGGCYRNLANPQISHVDVTNSPSMAGKAVLICRPNSHPFVVRTLILEQPVKIGRSVARSRASQSNGIFDCKVLSRNHALIWYNNGKFYLQDTKSSNGTFVNNQRLSKSGEESQPREVSSGDIVQFGVDVLENARKVTHGCIVANLKLYLPDGKEAKASPSTSVLSGGYKISIEDLYQLNIHIQDALQREQLLETKLAALEKLVSSLRDAADTGWKALIAEDRLLSRVEILENQLQTYAKNFPEDKLREELRKLQEDKNVYQGLAKDCLQKALQEKLEAVHKCHDIERVLMNTEAECANLKFEMMRDRDELQELAVKHNNQFLKSIKLQDKLEDAEEQHKEALARLEAENEELSSEVKRLLANEAVMHEKIQQLETSGEIVGRQLLGIQSQFQIRKSPEILDMSLLKERNGIATDVICKNNDEDFDNEKQMNDSNVDTIVSRLMLSVEDHKRSKEFVELMEAQVSLLQSEKMAKLQQINSLEGELEVHDDKVCKYKEELKKLEQSLVTLEQRLKDETNKLEASIIAPLVTDTSRSSSSERLSNGPQPVNIESLQTQINDLKEAIKEVRGKMEEMEETIDLRQADLNSAKKALTEITKNWILQDEKFQEAQTMRKESEATVTLLGEQLKALESSFLQSKIQEKVDEESEHINKHKEEATLLRKQLMETQQAAKQNRNETELVREKLRTVMEELEAAKAALTECQPDNRTSEELAELSATKQEAASLHDQVVSLEFLVKKLKEENNQKQSEPVQTSFTGTIILEENEEITEKLRLRVSEMEDELVLVKEKYVACNEKNTQLEKEIFSLRQDYEAIVHQPYFNVVFVLPLIVLFIAMTIFFHPTLAPLMGTFDNSLPNS